ncbi:class I histocompatibility antigen, F10 alpha chain [Pelodiscus sinensis]|uniref:class I histocompatibility antigen, F10 alpha chain n=1 Tax=Pelodiscus sinensis TaxID=13735 RepID=UPI003F6B7CCB
MAQHVSQEYWDEQTWRARRWQAWFQRSLSALRELHNHSGGFHIIQTMYGCDLREDNTTRGFYQDSYDGRDFLTFDKETMTWVAADIGAQITKRRFDADVSGKRRWKVYMEEECIQWLKSFLEYGKETLQRKVRPTVRVRGRSAHDGLRTLSCTVSGFYPRHITATWLRNGESREQDTYSAGPLPNGDGTYRTWVTMEIDPQTNAQYACRVEHESLLEPLSVPWEPDNHRIPAVAGGVTAALLVAMGIGAVVWKKKCSGKEPGIGMGASLHPLTLQTPPSGR